MTATTSVCGYCGASPARPDARFCDACGSALTDNQTPAEFKHVTVLFADVVRSMDMAAALGPERLREIMARLFDGAAAVVRRFGGTVDKFTGDGLMALFGAPVALEHHALQACRAALEILDSVRDLTDEVAMRDGIDVRIRIGLNSGEVVTGEIGSGSGSYTAIGQQVGMAQRMESVARPNGVMLSESTARLVESVAQLGQPESVTIKGSAAPVMARQLLAVPDHADSSGRVDTPLVGRRWEMAALRGLLDNAIDRRGTVLGIAGPPGIGKSRLTREIAAMAAERGAEVVVAYCESHTSGVPFNLASQLLRAAFGINGLDPQTARAQIREQVAGASDEDLLLLDDLVGVADPSAPLPQIAPDARRRRVSALLNTASLARDHPVVFVVEDAHWIDAVSESMLMDFLPVVPHTPTLFVITYRPEYRRELATISGAQTIALAPLSDSDTDSLLDRLLGTDSSLVELATTIGERSAGNPFFAEEIVRELSQRGVLQGERGSYRTTLDIKEIRVPATLQATIAARIDRLSPSAKRTLGAASVIGSRFEPDLIEGLGVEVEVDELLDAQLIDQVQFTPGPVYGFHHPLIRTVAYESQLVASRGTLHRRLAQAIEDRGRPDEDAALIAEHLEAAGDLRAAYAWHMRAGAWSTNRSITAAHTSWNRASGIADRLHRNGEPDGTTLRIAPLTLICGSAWRLGGSGAENGFEELRRLCEEAGDLPSLAIGMTGEMTSCYVRSQRGEAARLASELAGLLKTIGDPTLTVAVAPLVMVAWMDAGRFEEVLPMAELAIAAAGGDPRKGALIIPSPLALTFAVRGNTRLGMGLAGWRDDFSTALSICTDEPLARAAIEQYVYCGLILFGALKAGALTADHTAETLALAEQSGDDMTLNLARSTHGMVLLHTPGGDCRRGLELLKQVRDEALADHYSRPTLYMLEAEISRFDAQFGRLDDGVRTLTAAMESEYDTHAWAWLHFTALRLVETLVQRGNADDHLAAAAVADRFADVTALDGLVTRDMTLHRMHALISQAQGDDTAYRTHLDRYRRIAHSLGLEGHMEWADAMP